MKTIDEQLLEIQKRGNCLLKKRERQKKIGVDLIAAAVCVFLMAVTAYYLTRIRQASEHTVSHRYGSLVLNTPYIGYVVIGVLAFLLGVFLTLLCSHLRRRGR